MRKKMKKQFRYELWYGKTLINERFGFETEKAAQEAAVIHIRSILNDWENNDIIQCGKRMDHEKMFEVLTDME